MQRAPTRTLSAKAPEFNPNATPRRAPRPTSSNPNPNPRPPQSSRPTSSSNPVASSSTVQNPPQPTPVQELLAELAELAWLKEMNLDMKESLNLALSNILTRLCDEACGEPIPVEIEDKISSYLHCVEPVVAYPNMVFIPKIFIHYCQLARKNPEMVKFILDPENLYWMVMYCIQGGIYRSWIALRNLILDLNVEIHVELFLEMVHTSNFETFRSGLRIIEEASQLGIRDHRFEAAIVRFQRIVRRQPVEPRVRLLNLHQVMSPADVDGAHLNLLRYNKSLYPHVMTKMTASIFQTRWNNQTWVESYRMLNDPISCRYDKVCRYFIDILNKMCIGCTDNWIKIQTLATYAQVLCPNFGEYHPVQLLRQNHSMLIKLRFNVHRFKNAEEPTELPKILHHIPYRFMRVILEILPWLTVCWGIRVIEVFKRVQLRRVTDAVLRFWFFHISDCQPEDLPKLYPGLKVRKEKLCSFFSDPMTYPAGLDYPVVPENYLLHFKDGLPYFAVSTGSDEENYQNSPEASSSQQRTLISRVMDRRKIRLMVEAHLRQIQKTYQNHKQPEEHKLSYNEIIVEPIKIR